MSRCRAGGPPGLRGDRVALRRITADDADDVVRLRSDPTVLAQLFSDVPPTAEGHRRWCAEIEARGDRHEFIVRELASGRTVGTIGLGAIDRANRRAEYGVLLEPGARGKGFAAEASRLLLAYAFGTLGLTRVYLHVLADNEPALRLYRRVGFTTEGVLRQHAVKAGRARDVMVMAMLAPGCELCRRGVPFHTNAAASIGGDGRHEVRDLHAVAIPGGVGLAECPDYVREPDALPRRPGSGG